MTSFQKSERMHSKISIDCLFRRSNFFTVENIKVYWNESSSNDSKTKILLSVPKDLIPKAVNRNKIKRYLRESYRINKDILKLRTPSLEVGFCYLSSETPNFRSIEKKIKLILQRLNKEV